MTISVIVGTSCWRKPEDKVCLLHSGMGPLWWCGWRWVVLPKQIKSPLNVQTCKDCEGLEAGMFSISCLLPLLCVLAVGGDASLVRGCLPSQCEKRCYHVSPVWHGNPAGDRDQQSPAQAQAQAGHPGNHVINQPLCPSHLKDGKETHPALNT